MNFQQFEIQGFSSPGSISMMSSADISNPMIQPGSFSMMSSGDISNPIIQPTLPYVGAIPGGIKPGMAVFLQGAVLKEAKSFKIHFQMGQADGSDIAFYFNPRIGEKIYLNSFRKGSWEKEETVSNNPFTKEAAFIMIVVVSSEGYEVYVNNVQLCMFKHRFPVDKVSTLGIRGDVSFSICGFINDWNSSSFCKEQQTITVTETSSVIPIQLEIVNPISSPALPYMGPIPGGIKPQMAVFFQGAVPANAKSFVIKLQTSQAAGADIAFQLNPRIGNNIYLNSFRNRSWEKEETVSDNPFTSGSPLIMFIVIKSDGYEIFANGRRPFMFKHRIPVEKVSTLAISGDVSLSICGFINTWNSSILTEVMKLTGITVDWMSTSYTVETKTTITWISVLSFTPIMFEVLNPIRNPVLPYVDQIPGGIKPNMAVFFQGTLPADATAFVINFQTGQSDGADIAFHFNPRIGEKVYLKSFRNGKWEEEETVSDNPFTKGAAFILFVVINPDGYEVYVNGLRHCMFKHHIPIEKVTTLAIKGTVSFSVCAFLNNWSSSPCLKEVKKIKEAGSSALSLTPIMAELLHPVSSPALPYVGKIPIAVKQYLAVFFQGTVTANAKSFAIHFCTGPSEGDDIAFHFNPCMGQFTVLNSFKNGQWETEESAPDKPFTAGAPFYMIVVITSNGYEVYVNDQRHSTFNHRIPFEKVNTIRMVGEVSTNVIAFIDNWKTSPFFREEKTTFTITESVISGSTPIKFEVLYPVSKPALPYVGKIPVGLKHYMALFIQGTLQKDAKGFAINFCTGPLESDDIALYFNPRMGQFTALNSFRKGQWETEESAPDKPFTAGAPFYMIVVITSNGYEVYVNDQRHSTFNHRIPFEKVNTIRMVGDVSTNIIGFIDNWKTSPFFREEKTTVTITESVISGSTPIKLEVLYPVSKPALPYVGKIPVGLKHYMALFFQGTLQKDAKGFAINFCTGPLIREDIALCFNPRMGQFTALNSLRKGQWDTEESAPDKPFTAGAPFYMIVVITSNGYEVYVNDQRHSTFNHRIPFEKVNTIRMVGDVSTNIIGFIDNWKTSPFFREEKTTVTITESVISGSSPIKLEVLYPVSKPALPYVGKIPVGLKHYMALFFQGTLQKDAKGFAINFCTGPLESDDIALCFNPRMGQFTALNSFRKGKWETEESAPDKPFTAGAPFYMIVVITSNGYEVYVNDQRHSTFNHRIPFEKVNTIRMVGDVSTNIIGFIDNWKTSPFFREEKTTVTITESVISGSTPIKLEVLYPVSKPALPYVGKIPVGLKHYMALFFQGTLQKDAKGFAINFCTGPLESDDIALCFNPRMGQFTALNSFRKGKWDTEESAPDKPFTAGAPFYIIVVITSNGYEVYVNDQRHSTFNHRIPFEKVNTIRMVGEVSTNIIGFIDNWKTSPFFREEKTTVTITESVISGSTPIKLEVLYPVSKPALPYVGKIPVGLKHYMALFFQGTLQKDAKRFAINFCTGPLESDDIALCFNPRMGQFTALNSFRKGQWDTEESAPDKPFTAGAPFYMIVVITSNGYEVYVNDQRHSTFNHRIPFEKVNTIRMVGDVSTNIIGFIDNWKTSPFFREEKTTVTITESVISGSTPIKLEVLYPVSKPALPYVGKIPVGLKHYMALFFQGTLQKDAKGFAINFCTGPLESDDIALCFNPRMGQFTALNSFRKGQWETEESAPDKPFTAGAPFYMIVVITSNGYEVYVNDQRHSTFNHRIPFEKVNTIRMVGEVSTNIIGFIDNWKTSPFFREEKTTVTITESVISGSTPIKLEVLYPVSKPALPYVGKIPVVLKHYMALFFQGTLQKDAKRFAINFGTGPLESDDIALCFNPRMGQFTALNSFRKGKWDTEESAPDKPFTAGAPFYMIVVITSNGYEVYVNDQRHSTFNHRIPFEKVNTIRMVGDVSTNIIGFIDNWKTSPFFREEKTTVTITESVISGSTPIKLEVLYPVSKPALPYVGKIPVVLKHYMALFFQGTLQKDAKRFAINFGTGPLESDDIALCFNPRMGQFTALNSFRKGKWDTEESAPDKPFTAGAPFYMIVVITSNGYEVYVNDQRHCTFNHRIPFEKVNTIRMVGDVSTNIIGFIDNWKTSPFFREEKTTVTITESVISGSTPIKLEVLYPVSKPALPYVGKIPVVLQHYMALFFQGTLQKDAKRFAINFGTGPLESDDIALCFNPRMGQFTALNSFRKGKWDTEESAPDKPFTAGAPFYMIVVITSNGYEVYVNDQRHSTFNHRIPFEKVNTIRMVGDVSTNIIGFIDNWKTSPFFREEKTTVTITESVISGSTPIKLEVLYPVSKPALPYVGKIPVGLKHYMALFFQGTLQKDAKGFAINFCTGPLESDDIALCFNPHMGQFTALNSFRKGQWESEESAPDKPFTAGAPFYMIVVITSNGYEVYVNDQRHSTFNHRIPFEKVNTIRMVGDVSTNIIGFIDNWKTSPFFREEKTTVTITESVISGSTPIKLEVLYPVSKPALPYVGKIPVVLQHYMALFFQGTLQKDAKRFAINFGTGPLESDDIALCFNPRMGQFTALNSFRKGKWDTEESAPDKPFTAGAPFYMIVVITSNGYEVYVNDQRHSTFNHRIPFEKVNTIRMVGDVSTNIIGFIDNWKTSPFFREEKTTVTITESVISGSTPIKLEVLYPVSKPALPYVGKIPVGLKHYMALFFQGTLQKDAKGFAINFCTGPLESDDIALCFNPHMGQFTALNSFRKGQWESEESAPDKPFTAGAPFYMIVVITSNGYEVYVNDQRHSTFNHRIPFEKVNTIRMVGDVSTNIIGFIDNWKTSPFFREEKTTVTITESIISGSTPIKLEVLYPVSKPALPYVGKIPVELKHYMALFIQGTLQKDAKRFAINFCTGPLIREDIALCFNPRMGQFTALNSLRKGKWDTEESAPDKPFTAGAPFYMIVVITSNGYEVYVNDQRHSTFNHRIPFEKVNTIRMVGDVSTNIIGFIDNWKTSPFFREEKTTVTITESVISGSTPIKLEVLYPVSKPALPYVGKIPVGLKHNMALFFQGTLQKDAKGFAINFCTGPLESEDIALCFNPRMGQFTALNSFRKGQWDTEESAPDKPFTAGAPFYMIVVITSNGYEVYVNDQRHSTFNHRIPFEKVNTIRMVGDVSTNIIGFIENWKTSPFFREEKTTVTITESVISGSTPIKLEVLYPVSKPALPYVGKIPVGLKHNMALFIQGTLQKDAKGFAINFCMGPSEGDDIAFYFNPCIGQYTTLNSFRKGKWDTEESAPDKPFTAGAPFYMIVVITSNGYEVYVNDQRHSTFNHRIPFEKVNTIRMVGDVSTNIIGFIENWKIYKFVKEEKVPVTLEGPDKIPIKFEVLYPVSKPALPYMGKIPLEIKHNMALFMHGTVRTDAKSFDINFYTGSLDGDDIAFHFKPRIGQYTALNSFRSGQWETEESAPIKPFTAGAPFFMFVVITPNGYEVYVNGEKHCTFNHRISFEKWSRIQLCGDVSINIFGFIQNFKLLAFFKESKTTLTIMSTDKTSIQFEVSYPVSKPALPYVGKIPVGIKPHMALFFQGTLQTDAKSFDINLYTGPADGDDIAFHFNPRIGQYTTLNSFRNGQWETEESAPIKPFTAGAQFFMFFVITPNGYEVYVNSQKHCTFNHRIPFEKLSTIRICGNISISIIGFIENWKTSPLFK